MYDLQTHAVQSYRNRQFSDISMAGPMQVSMAGTSTSTMILAPSQNFDSISAREVFHWRYTRSIVVLKLRQRNGTSILVLSLCI